MRAGQILMMSELHKVQPLFLFRDLAVRALETKKDVLLMTIHMDAQNGQTFTLVIRAQITVHYFVCLTLMVKRTEPFVTLRILQEM